LNYKSCARDLIHGGAALEDGRTSYGDLRGPLPPLVSGVWGTTGVGNRLVRSEKKREREKKTDADGDEG